MAIKRAKTLNKEQFNKAVKIVRKGNHALRDEVALMLSFYAGLRAGEIAHLRWWNNLLDAQGNLRPNIHITSDVGKRAVEREIPIAAELREALLMLRRKRPEDEYVFYALHNHVIPMIPVLDAAGQPIWTTALDMDGKPLLDKKTKEPLLVQKKKVDPDFIQGKVSSNAVVQWFKRMYAQVGYEGCTSHSGRRTFITVRARECNKTGNSLKDVQLLAGHSRLETTAGYIEPSDQHHRLVKWS